jgi:hypothetical protein
MKFNNILQRLHIQRIVQNYYHVSGVCVTNNNGFWIERLDLLTASFTITHNHDQLQELTINLQQKPSSLTAEDSPHSRSLSF